MVVFAFLSRLVRAVLALAFLYARPALALTLLVSPILCTLLTLDTDGDPVAACCMLAVWGLMMAMHALPRDVTRTPSEKPDGMAESIVLGLAGVKTLQILHASGAHNQTLWVIAATSAAGIIALKHVDEEWVRPGGAYMQIDTTTTTVRERPMGTRVPLAMIALVLAVGMLRAMVFTPTGSDFGTATLTMAETAICILLLVRVYLAGATDGMEESMLGMLYLHACVFPVTDIGSIGGILYLVEQGVMLLSTFVSTAQIDPRAKLLEVPWAVVEGVVELAVRLVGSTSVWQVVILVSFGAVVRAMGSEWYTAHADFPEELQTIARTALDIIAYGPKLFMELTNRDEVQEFMVEVVPEISGPRGLIVRILKPIIVSFEQGRDGVDYTLLPLNEFFSMLAFAIGPLVAALGVLVQIFATGAAFAKSRWFWAFCAWGCMLFAILTQVVAGPKVTAVALIFLGASYRRDYTEEGQYALLGLLVQCGACLVLFVITSQTESDTLKLLRQSHTGTGGRPVLDEQQGRRAKRETPSCATILKRGARRLVGLVASPAFVLLVAGVAVIGFAALLKGSPVKELDVNKIETLPPHIARWLKITTLDRVAALQATFVGFLVQVFGSDVRLAFLLRYLIQLVMQQVQCLPCLCMPGVSEINGVFTAASDAISGGFRSILEAKEHWTEQQPYMVNGTYSKSPLRRRTLFSFDPSQPCTRPSSSCDGAAICISDILEPIVDIFDFLQGLLTQGMHEGVRLLVEHVLQHVPGFNQISDVFGSIGSLNQYEDFDALNMATFTGIPGRLLGVVFGALSNLHFPGFDSQQLSTTWIVFICLTVVGVLVLLVKLGLFEPLVQSAFSTLGASLALSFLAFLVGLMFFCYGAVNELRIQGWEIHVSFHTTPLAWNAIGLGLVLVACFLVVGSASAVELEKTRAELAAPKAMKPPKKRELTPAPPTKKKQPPSLPPRRALKVEDIDVRMD